MTVGGQHGDAATPPPGDQMVVLSNVQGKLATKKITAAGIENYPKGATWFAFDEWAIANFGEMATALNRLQARPYSFVVRGSIIPGTNRQCDRRRASKPPATLAAAARRWVLLDFDSTPAPEGVDPVFEPDRTVEHLMQTLPAMFHGISCHWAFTASQNFAPGIRMRLAFWADRPVSDRELKILLAAAPVDKALYSANQPHYTARPIFEGARDPVPFRCGVWRGYTDTVAVPPIETAKPRQASAERPFDGTGGIGYEHHRARIGDGEGRDGFYGPLKAAIGAWLRYHGSEVDTAWLRADLERAMRKAPRDPALHPDDYIDFRCGRDLDNLIAAVRAAQAADEAAAIEPTYPAPLGSVEAARTVLADAVREFADAARAGRDDLDTSSADDTPEPPARGIATTVGTGKTRIVREQLVEPLIAAGLNVFVTVPEHSLGSQYVHDLVGTTGQVYRGRSAADPDADGEKMCREHERAAAIVAALGDVARSACGRPGAFVCEHFDSCGYRKQAKATPQIWVGAHQLLFHPRPKFIPAPDALVIDEDFADAALHGTDRPVWIDLADLLANRNVRSATTEGSAYATADLRATSLRAFNALSAGADGWVPRSALLAAGLTAAELGHAHAAEWQCKIELDDVLPGMPRAEAIKLIKIAGRHNARVARLARLWKLLARQLDEGLERSPWLELSQTAPLHDDETGPGIRMTWRSEIHESWRAPTLLLDATLQPEIARVFFPQLAEPVQVDAPMPHAHVRQITDRAMSHAMFVESEGAGEKRNSARRANIARLRRYIEVRAADVAPGRCLVICQLDVETLLKAGALPANVETAHFGAIRGLNQWSDVALLIVVGRTEASPRTVERIARALFGADIAEIPADAKGNVFYPRVARGLRMRDGSGRRAEGGRHSDPLAEAIRFSICEAELVHAVGRGRGVNRTADNSLQIDIVTNVCLPGVEVNKVATWDKIQPGTAQVMRARGAVPLNYADMAAAYPDLFPSWNAARMTLDRENPAQTSIGIFLIDVCAGFLSVGYRRHGSRGPPGRLLYDPAKIDPQAWLQEKLGDVTVLPACQWFVVDEGRLRRCGAEVAPGMTWCAAHVEHAAAIAGQDDHQVPEQAAAN